jgi:glycosyltransferase involved in cell wall biosynthesis
LAHTVCHLIDSNIGSGFFKSIARYHDAERFPVMIGSIAPSGALQDDMNRAGVPAFSLGVRSRSGYPLAIARLVRLLRRERISILHAHCFDPTAIGLVAARASGVEFIFTRHHSNHHVRLGKKWHTRIDGWSARHANHVIAVSGDTRRIMTDIEGVPQSNITVVYNGMEPLPAPSAEHVAKLAQELAIDDGPVILMLARFHPEKGHIHLLEALPEVNSRLGPVTVLLAGDGPYRKEIERYVVDKGLSHIVRFLGQRTDVSDLIELSSLVVLPSLAESFGFAVLEAMSLGKPVVASRISGIPEVVDEGKTGLLVAPGDPAALADAICRILESPGLGNALGEAGKQRAAQFTFERMIRGYERVYEEVVSRHTVDQSLKQADVVTSESARRP